MTRDSTLQIKNQIKVKNDHLFFDFIKDGEHIKIEQSMLIQLRVLVDGRIHS